MGKAGRDGDDDAGWRSYPESASDRHDSPRGHGRLVRFGGKDTKIRSQKKGEQRVVTDAGKALCDSRCSRIRNQRRIFASARRRIETQGSPCRSVGPPLHKRVVRRPNEATLEPGTRVLARFPKPQHPGLDTVYMSREPPGAPLKLMSRVVEETGQSDRGAAGSGSLRS